MLIKGRRGDLRLFELKLAEDPGVKTHSPILVIGVILSLRRVTLLGYLADLMMTPVALSSLQGLSAEVALHYDRRLTRGELPCLNLEGKLLIKFFDGAFL
jgi:hypothetical protein